MVISVNFHGTQRSVTQTDKMEMPIKEQTNVADVFGYVKDQYPELPIQEKAVLVVVNQKVATFEKSLQANDKVSFLPHIGGG